MKPFFFIREQGKYVRINFSDIHYLEARSNYVQIVTTGRSFLCLATLRQMVKLLPEDWFCQIHRSFIIGIAHLQSFDTEHAWLPDKTIPIGDRYRTALHRRVTMVRCKAVEEKSYSHLYTVNPS